MPRAEIVFDLFRVIANFGRVVDKVGNSEYPKAGKANKADYKGTWSLLSKSRENLKAQVQRQHLKELLALNETNYTVMILKDKLKYRARAWTARALDNWCALAQSLNNPSINAFTRMLKRYRYGILNHSACPISTGRPEGVNNKIKVIKRKTYGFHDRRYFTLKIYQSFSS